ncbi:hypothetical protein AGABI2DRAFT_122928 [Agaricus bisporus var. bisporus H97]|uniref:hypothetical protein n=1 Tax=Agaricus bisporus var. bisporus (strain H97 / ATCC MYA-4626 / FGSC 10389) TaxID=936046 RepID=UPI00029F751A|nr:hypothetical protein AGABI2DRAFT_122928 [Agaricus bisporus var. bisporus H97]EKV42199.1 hypothetical protein AGABI2DRAFT_122928 [Agaricus bisporus var. bisporus H97]
MPLASIAADSHFLRLSQRRHSHVRSSKAYSVYETPKRSYQALLLHQYNPCVDKVNSHTQTQPVFIVEGDMGLEPLHNPEGRKALLEHSIQTYGPPSSEPRVCHCRSRKNSCPSPYPHTRQSKVTSPEAPTLHQLPPTSSPLVGVPSVTDAMKFLSSILDNPLSLCPGRYSSKSNNFWWSDKERCYPTRIFHPLLCPSKMLAAPSAIISPTRELATQIVQDASKPVRHIYGFSVHSFDILDSSTDVPESVFRTQTPVLDEADSLLDIGFQPGLLEIQEYLPSSCRNHLRTFLFFVTISNAILDITLASLARQHRYVNCVSANRSPVHTHIPHSPIFHHSSLHQTSNSSCPSRVGR